MCFLFTMHTRVRRMFIASVTSGPQSRRQRRNIWIIVKLDWNQGLIGNEQQCIVNHCHDVLTADRHISMDVRYAYGLKKVFAKRFILILDENLNSKKHTVFQQYCYRNWHQWTLNISQSLIHANIQYEVLKRKWCHSLSQRDSRTKFMYFTCIT